MFPSAFPTTVNVQVNRTNELYDGWDVRLDRLFFANGIRDPWKDATVSSVDVSVPSTDSQPIAVGDGFHCSDLLTESGTVDSTVRAVQVKALSSMKEWIADYKPQKKGHGTTAARSSPNTSNQPPRKHFMKPINAFGKGAGLIVN
ncbi:hypothetical protein H0H93_012846 [Arthromyces matolae]|nr:hypothetical protein H0H93_012846 [Arthromyces matolae]